MTTEVLRAVAEGAVKTAMSIEPMVEKTADFGNWPYVFICFHVAVLIGAIAVSKKK